MTLFKLARHMLIQNTIQTSPEDFSQLMTNTFVAGLTFLLYEKLLEHVACCTLIVQ